MQCCKIAWTCIRQSSIACDVESHALIDLLALEAILENLTSLSQQDRSGTQSPDHVPLTTQLQGALCYIKVCRVQLWEKICLWHHVTMMTRPPGWQTLTSSLTNLGLVGMCSPLSKLHTRSNEPSSKGWSKASATWKLHWSPKPSLLAISFPLAACGGHLWILLLPHSLHKAHVKTIWLSCKQEGQTVRTLCTKCYILFFNDFHYTWQSSCFPW